MPMPDIDRCHEVIIIEEGLREIAYPLRCDALHVRIHHYNPLGSEFRAPLEKIQEVIAFSQHPFRCREIDFGRLCWYLEKYISCLVGRSIVAVDNYAPVVREELPQPLVGSCCGVLD